MIGSRIRSLTLALLFCAALAEAQTNTEDFAQLRFNFNNPGARATGLGGAFISLADDATAAEANPAGLTTLIRPELSVEVKGIGFTRHVDNFSQNGNATDYSLVGRDFRTTVFSPSFATIVYPHRRFTFSAFRYELVRFKSNFYTEGSFVAPRTDRVPFYPATSTMDLSVVNWGAALAYKISDRLSVGVSSGVSNIRMQSALSRYAVEIFTPATLLNAATIDASKLNYFFNIGVIYRPTEDVSVGAIFKRRPTFTLPHTFQITYYPTDSIATQDIHFNVPSSVGLGFSYRPSDLLTLSFDAVRVFYSSLTKDFVLTINEQYATNADFAVDDGMEYHVGGEYVVLTRRMGFVFRGGFYVEPDTRIRWTGPTVYSNLSDSRLQNRQFLAALFQKGDPQIHYTFGLGLVFSNNFQLDLAGNLSKETKEAVGSFVVRL